MTSITFERSTRQYLLPASLLVLMLLAVGKDLLHAFIKDYHFYLSESMLFGSYWLLFVPLVWINLKISHGYRPMYSILFPLLSGFLHITLFSLLVFAISGLFFDHTFGVTRVFADTLADHGISCLLIYAAVHYFFIKDVKNEIEVPAASKRIRVTHQNKVLFLACEDILYVRTERPYIALVTKERTYLHGSTLKKFKKEQLTDSFIQIHKSAVVNTAFITSYKSRQNGDYDVLMANGETVRASRNFNSYFKSNP